MPPELRQLVDALWRQLRRLEEVPLAPLWSPWLEAARRNVDDLEAALIDLELELGELVDRGEPIPARFGEALDAFADLLRLELDVELERRARGRLGPGRSQDVTLH